MTITGFMSLALLFAAGCTSISGPAVPRNTAVAAPSQKPADTPAPTSSPTPTPTPTPSPTPTPDPVEVMLEGMTDEELLAQMIMIGFYGDTQPDALTEELLKAGRVENIIFFSRNVKDAATLKELCNKLNALSPSSLPLFLAVDEEGGRVTRLPYEDKIPAARVLGDSGDPQQVYSAGLTIARRLQECGMNMDFAPVLDIMTNPENTVIGNRAFGSDPQTVATMGLAMNKALTDEGIITSGKHFPGHGDTYADSHKELPHSDSDMERLLSVELVPFKAAIEAGIPSILASHVMLEKIDSEYPASMSKVLLQDILRKQLGYEGMIVTDDMTMGAVMTQYDLGEACVRAVEAGCDLILICHEDEYRTRGIEALEEAVRMGRITHERLQESARRILKLKMDLMR